METRNGTQRVALAVDAPPKPRFEQILSAESLGFLEELARRFAPAIREALDRRAQRLQRLARGESLDFLPETASIRAGDWRVAPLPHDLERRIVEITGPTDRKMVINALNSGARVFMADFEDANSPTWENLIGGQANLIDAIERRIDFQSPDGKAYRLREEVATLMVRPRGWHLPEKHLAVDGAPASASLLDFGLYFFHNARRLTDKGSG